MSTDTIDPTQEYDLENEEFDASYDEAWAVFLISNVRQEATQNGLRLLADLENENLSRTMQFREWIRHESDDAQRFSKTRIRQMFKAVLGKQSGRFGELDGKTVIGRIYEDKGGYETVGRFQAHNDANLSKYNFPEGETIVFDSEQSDD